ncbi:hypothetical protein GCM10009733_082630 [Nonomuraea maheshkhaliensis]|uniref:SGNH hydrolase-type esterase domain-containing protein n=1 Tax=Nonomuraea maheshkhaliensis TaxID=419590 RepID=A0ABN2GKW2_9ACTN
MTGYVRRLINVVTAVTVAVGLCAPAGAEARPPSGAEGGVEPAPAALSTVPSGERDRLLPAGWRTSEDLAWTTTGDPTGFHLLVAESRTGYTWRTAATLSEPGFETDRWIGQACLTGSGRHAVVVYAPRTFTNRDQLFARGGFAAVVEVATGAVSKLDVNVSLAYHNPGCGTGDEAVLTQGGAVDLGKTRLHLVDPERGRIAWTATVRGQATSAVPFAGGIVTALGSRLVDVDRRGRVRHRADTAGVAFDVRAGGDGGLVFLERRGEVASAVQLHGGTRRRLAQGEVAELALKPGTGGRIHLTGRPAQVAALPEHVTRVEAPTTADVSTLGRLVVTHEPQVPGGARRGVAGAVAAEPGTAQPVSLRGRVVQTGKEVEFVVDPAGRPSRHAAQGRVASGGLKLRNPAGAARATAADEENDPVDHGYTCAVPRNDPRTQVYQPHWRQVEWAVDLAVHDALRTARPADWKGSGLPSWSPQGMYASIPLLGREGGKVPAAILNAVIAQESNMWQASPHALEGVAGNPLVGNFYGRISEDEWGIHWNKADCGYGVAQVTTGMRRGDTSRNPTRQRAIALDYATNIAAGLNILQEKWNQTYSRGVRINNADPSKIENWFAAVWAYNTGFQPDHRYGNTTGCLPGPNCTDEAGRWGLGWTNNPAMPDYPPNRKAFLDSTYDDARHPQHWPYPEKIIGWAGHPIVKDGGNDHGYRYAWWSSEGTRRFAKPPLDLFCRPSNDCDPGRIGTSNSPCTLNNFRCWFHEPATWKPACEADCGHDSTRYHPGDPEPPDADTEGAYTGDSRPRYRPNCRAFHDADGAANSLPGGTLVIDDVPSSVPSIRPGCTRDWTNSGTFQLTFGFDGADYRSKIDFHQIGGGFGGHFWFAHTRNDANDPRGVMPVTGTWTLDRPINGWARVFAHMPDHGAHTQQAQYDIHLGDGRVKKRTLLQRTYKHQWVSLGVVEFAGTPKISLSTRTRDGDGSEDVAWDAVAVQPLPGKPRHLIVALGDSYASGEGASADELYDYYRESNNNGGNDYRNACHRSRHAWSRKAFLADKPLDPIDGRADSFDPTLDYHLLACSGAQTENLLPSPAPGEEPITNAWGERARGRYREVSQLDRGFLDENTTLVTLSIGGNDARFSDVLTRCLLPTVLPCQATTLDGESQRMEESVPFNIATKLEPSMRTVLRVIHTRAPNAKIVLMGYPRLFENSGSCVMAPEEGAWLNGLSDSLAEDLRRITDEERRVSGIPVSFADPREDFAGKSVCNDFGSDGEAIHRFIPERTSGEPPSNPVSSQSFHPKISGTSLYAATLNRALRALDP